MYEKTTALGQTWVKSCWPKIESISNRSRARAASRANLLIVVDAFVNTSGSWPSSPKTSSLPLESSSPPHAALAPTAAIEPAPVAAEAIIIVRFALYTDLGISGYINKVGAGTSVCISTELRTWRRNFCDSIPCVGMDKMLITATSVLPANTETRLWLFG